MKSAFPNTRQHWFMFTVIPYRYYFLVLWGSGVHCTYIQYRTYWYTVSPLDWYRVLISVVRGNVGAGACAKKMEQKMSVSLVLTKPKNSRH